MSTARIAFIALLSLVPYAAKAQQADMTFFVTSAGPGKGADLGGLEGADAHCAKLAQAAGAKATNWKAYLSTQSVDGKPAVNARDRIGAGPWQNAKGVVVAKDVAEMHGANNLTKQTALTEKGDIVNGRGDNPNMHDMLTGSTADGMAFPAGKDMTCGNWTKSGEDGSAIVGHSDRTGLDQSAPMISWISSHPTRGCTPAGLQSTGGAGLFYCFAAK